MILATTLRQDRIRRDYKPSLGYRVLVLPPTALGSSSKRMVLTTALIVYSIYRFTDSLYISYIDLPYQSAAILLSIRKISTIYGYQYYKRKLGSYSPIETRLSLFYSSGLSLSLSKASLSIRQIMVKLGFIIQSLKII